MIVVIADDITGAAEIAGVCLRYGLSVSFGIDELPAFGTDIFIIATDSRSQTENEAFRIHKKIAEVAFRQPNAFIFKKCDSALRGYILTELLALTEAGGFDTVVLQPANPLSGRLIKNGEYYIGADKIENTGFSHDPDFPTDESLVRNILLGRSSKPHQNFDIQTGTISRINTKGIYIPDCSSVDELVKSYNLAGDKTLFCGSAAFYEQILIKRFNRNKSNQNVKFAFPNEFLLISGSTHPGSRSFIDNQKENNCSICTLPENLCLQEVSEKDIEKWTYELVNEWNNTKRLIVTSSTIHLSFPDGPQQIGRRIGTAIQKFLQQASVNEIFVTGGATSYTLLKTLNWETLIPVSELAPGVVRMKVYGTSTFLTLKPGSYSWPVTSVER